MPKKPKLSKLLNFAKNAKKKPEKIGPGNPKKNKNIKSRKKI